MVPVMSESTSGTRLAEPSSPPSVPEGRWHRGDLVAVVAALLLVGAAVWLGLYYNRPGSGVVIYAFAPPLYGDWLPHVAPGSLFAVLIAIAVVARGSALASRISWRRALAFGYLAALCWTFALAMVDGWNRGFAGRLTTDHEYLHEVPGITDIPLMLRQFSSRILDFRPDSWTTHVSGHPPGATLVFVWLDRIGLGGGGWAATACVAVGCLITVAVPATLSLLGRPDAARAILPFAVLTPGVIWIGASADGLFAGVTATAIALLALAANTTGRWYALPLALSSGLLLGFGAFLSYGLVLLAVVALVVGVLGRQWQVVAFAALGALAVAGAFKLAGFWWLDGYHLVVRRYYQGIASARPYSYWVWADVATLAISVGPAVIAGVRRTVSESFLVRPKRRLQSDPVLLIGIAALLTIAIADLSGLSKAEVERIWLPFAVWLLPATSLLPSSGRRWWLATQAATALLVNHLVLTIW
jgi:hypothetical protein